MSKSIRIVLGVAALSALGACGRPAPAPVSPEPAPIVTEPTYGRY